MRGVYILKKQHGFTVFPSKQMMEEQPSPPVIEEIAKDLDECKKPGDMTGWFMRANNEHKQRVLSIQYKLDKLDLEGAKLDKYVFESTADTPSPL